MCLQVDERPEYPCNAWSISRVSQVDDHVGHRHHRRSGVGLADVLKVLEAGFQARHHSFSGLESELGTALRSAVAGPGLLLVHLKAVGCHLCALLDHDHHSSC